MNKENIITKLKEQSIILETMKNDLQSFIDSVNTTINSLQDESKLGADATFDFGKDAQKEIIKSVHKRMLKGINALKQNQIEMEKLQQAGESYTSSISEDNVEKT